MNVSIGERLKQIREAKTMSQGDIEHRTGLLRCYVSRVENGHTIPNLETLEKWSKALSISMGELFAGDGKQPEAPVKFSSPGTKLDRATENNLQRLSVHFARLDKRDQAILLGLASKMSQ